MPEIKTNLVETERLKQYVRTTGCETGEAVVFIHGNFSSSTYFEELMLAMPDEYYCIAVDLRGYGDTEALTIDAKRGARDWSDDLHALIKTFGINSAHWLGWSAGAAAIMQLKVDHGECVKSLTLVAPVSPFGFGGTKNQKGDPCWNDFAGSGGGVVDSTFIERIKEGDKGREHALSPLNIIHQSYFFRPQKLDREKTLVDGSLKQKVGDEHYPGDSQISPNWPHMSPGNYGPLNAISAKYYDMRSFTHNEYFPPVLWVRGDKDVIISNRSSSDMGVLGELGLIPGWPGDDIYPPQPMVDQMRGVLDTYQKKDGQYQEVVLEDVGHSPFIEAPESFLIAFLAFLKE